MNDVFYRLGEYLIDSKPSYQTHFYRYRHLLKKPLKDLNFCDWASQEHEWKLAQELSLYAPLRPEDLKDQDLRRILRQWKKAALPEDPKFYQMLLRQNRIRTQYSDLSLEKFLGSKEGLQWLAKRKRLKRKPLFELDQPYKKSKQSSLKLKSEVRDLIRRNPLLRFEDLKALKIRNAQALLDSFPHRFYHRDSFLKALGEGFSVL